MPSNSEVFWFVCRNENEVWQGHLLHLYQPVLHGPRPGPQRNRLRKLPESAGLTGKAEGKISLELGRHQKG